MKALTETVLFKTFIAYSNQEKLAPDKLPAAYDQFVTLLSDTLAEDETIRHLRRLNYTKIELSFLKQECDTMTQGNHVLYDVFINKTLALLDAEIQIVKDSVVENRIIPTSYTEPKLETKNKKRTTTLTWNGKDSELIELVAALMAAGIIGSMEGIKVTIVEVIRVFEQAFHIKINALYTKRGKVFDRCSESTPFLDSLRDSYNRMLEKRLA